jgi:hypothetical protein
MRKALILLLAAAGCGVSGCVVPMLTEHPVQFNSEPPGAAVSHEGRTIGITPFVYDVRDDFGFFSTYEFVAHLPNRPDVSASFTERTVFDAQGVVPDVVNFSFAAHQRSKP